MSRNFELLQQAGRVYEVLNSEPRKQDVPVDNVTSGTPALELGGAAKDELTKLVRKLFLPSSPNTPRVVVFTGTEAGNGCSWVCAHAAEVLASQVTAPVCVVDCNLRAPSLHHQFGCENHYGLSEALRQNDPIRQFLRPLSRPNLWLLSCGSAPEEGHALLSADQMRLRLKELHASFEYVVIDTAAASTSGDSVFLGALADGAVLVLKANSSRRDTAQRAATEFHTANVPILGVVLNRTTAVGPEAIFGRF